MLISGSGLRTVPRGNAVKRWRQFKVGAGGYVHGIDFHTDGTCVVHTDFGGAFLRQADGTWKQIVTINSMPSGDPALPPNVQVGTYEIRISPSDSSVLYMMTAGYLYHSSNKGTNWNATGFAQDVNADANAGNNNNGRRIAVDPANSAIVYVGTSRGLAVSSNSGSSFSSVSSVTAPTVANDAGVQIAFDPTSSHPGNVTQGIYAYSLGNGLYYSSNGGSSFALVASGGPSSVTCIHLICDQNGRVWLTEGSSTANNVWKYTGGLSGTWTNMSANGCPSEPAGGFPAIAVNPNNANEIVIAYTFGGYAWSANGGTSWNTTVNVSPSSPAGQPAWLSLATSSGHVGPGATGDILYDPSQSNILYVASGSGVWYSDTTTFVAGSPSPLTCQSAGIEGLDCDCVVATPAGNILLAAWDFPIFSQSSYDTYASTYYPIVSGSHVGPPLEAAMVDYVSSKPASFVGRVTDFGSGVDYSGIYDNGTWTTFPSQPLSNATPLNGPGANSGGNICATTPLSIVMFGQDYGTDPNQPVYTTDGGSSWGTCSFPVSVPTSGNTGWGENYYDVLKLICADRVNGNYYAWNFNAPGLMVSTDGGATFGSPVGGASLNKGNLFFTWLAAMPSDAGYLFFTPGDLTDNSSSNPFSRSINGGVNWTNIANCAGVRCFGFGATVAGHSTVVFYGYYNHVLGVWESTDNCASFHQLMNSDDVDPAHPTGIWGEVRSISGDPTIAGAAYLAVQAQGWLAYR